MFKYDQKSYINDKHKMLYKNISKNPTLKWSTIYSIEKTNII